MQLPAFLQQEGEVIYPLDARLSPKFWEHLYNVMDRFYEQRKGITPTNRLIWFWATQKPFAHSKVHYEILHNLVPDSEYLLSADIIQCHIPEELQLISAYHKWFDVMDACIDKGKEPEKLEAFSYIFDLEDLEPEDNMQCVTAYIKRSWITGTYKIKPSVLRECFGE